MLYTLGQTITQLKPGEQKTIKVQQLARVDDKIAVVTDTDVFLELPESLYMWAATVNMFGNSFFPCDVIFTNLRGCFYADML